MIEGTTIRLRAWQKRDLTILQAMRNDVSLQGQLLARVRGSDIARVREWLQQRSAGPGSVLFIVADRRNDEALGYVQFTGLDPVDRHADLGICLTRQAQGHGVGSEVIRLTLPYLVDVQHVRKVGLRVRADNVAAIRCYRRIGFEPCGALRQHFFIDGEWHDVLLMELFL